MVASFLKTHRVSKATTAISSLAFNKDPGLRCYARIQPDLLQQVFLLRSKCTYEERVHCCTSAPFIRHIKGRL